MDRTDYSEKRQFGRRMTNIKAWVRIPGRPSVPCVLRNISQGGAMVEFDGDVWLPFSFRLTSEDRLIDCMCEVRHNYPRRVGVEFMTHAAGQDRIPDKRVEEVDHWMGPGNRR